MRSRWEKAVRLNSVGRDAEQSFGSKLYLSLHRNYPTVLRDLDF